MDEFGNVTLEYLFGTPFKNIKLYVGDAHDSLNKFEVTNIKVRDHDKIAVNRNFPLFLVMSKLDLTVDYRGAKPDQTMTISYDELHHYLLNNVISTMFDNYYTRESVIRF